MRASATILAAAIWAGAAWANPAADQILAADRAFNQLAQDKGAPEAFAAFSTPETRMFGGSAEPVKGPDGIRSLIAGMERPGWSLRWEPTYAEVSDDGTLGYTLGRWTRSGPGKDGAAETLTGSYVTIWRKQPDGSWKMSFDTGSPDRSE